MKQNEINTQFADMANRNSAARRYSDRRKMMRTYRKQRTIAAVAMLLFLTIVFAITMYANSKKATANASTSTATSTATQKATTILDTLMVTEVTPMGEDMELVNAVCQNGNVFSFYNDITENDPLYYGDLISIEFNTKGTDIVYDDEVVRYSYAGYLDIKQTKAWVKD